jgi:hypothetical protein
VLVEYLAAIAERRKVKHRTSYGLKAELPYAPCAASTGGRELVVFAHKFRYNR